MNAAFWYVMCAMVIWFPAAGALPQWQRIVKRLGLLGAPINVATMILVGLGGIGMLIWGLIFAPWYADVVAFVVGALLGRLCLRRPELGFLFGNLFGPPTCGLALAGMNVYGWMFW